MLEVQVKLPQVVYS